MRAHLLEVRELLSAKSRWTQKVLARTELGHSTAPLHPRAVCWCLMGAMYKVAGVTSTSELDACPLARAMRDALNEASCALYGRIAVHVNDRYQHHDVLNVLDLAILNEATKGW